MAPQGFVIRWKAVVVRMVENIADFAAWSRRAWIVLIC